jgi:recombinational DNA repair ATPase RecF
MDIQINNFKNISELTLQIDDKKVNFLFGISGSGKSSVCDAIMKKDTESNLKIGRKIEELKVLVNGKEPNAEEFEVFSMDSIKDYVINDLPNKKGYEIIVQDDSKIKEIQNNYRKSITKLSENIGYVYELKKDLNELKSKT